MSTCTPEYEKGSSKYSVVKRYIKSSSLFGKLCMGVAKLFQDGETFRFQNGEVYLFND